MLYTPPDKEDYADLNNDSATTENTIEEINLDDCDVPIGCPFGLDPAEDMFPNHH